MVDVRAVRSDSRCSTPPTAGRPARLCRCPDAGRRPDGDQRAPPAYGRSRSRDGQGGRRPFLDRPRTEGLALREPGLEGEPGLPPPVPELSGLHRARHSSWSTTPTSTGAPNERAKLAATVVTSALAPTNFPLLNPAVVERAYRDRRQERGQGARQHRRATSRPTTASPATSTGRPSRSAATWRSPPAPSSSATRCASCCSTRRRPIPSHAIPLVMVPPQINKYYFMDLAPGRSFVEFCVQQGLQMFTISWRNPTKEHRDWGLNAYVDAVRRGGARRHRDRRHRPGQHRLAVRRRDHHRGPAGTPRLPAGPPDHGAPPSPSPSSTSPCRP